MSPSLKTSCADIVNTMPYDSILQTFGPPSDECASVHLPFTLTSGTLIPSLHPVFALCNSSHSHPPTPPTQETGNSIDPANESVSASLRKIQLMLTPPDNSRRPLCNDHLHPRPLRRSVMVGYVARGRAVEWCMCGSWEEGEESCYW